MHGPRDQRDQSELVAVKLEDGWFLSVRDMDPSHGIKISDDAARMLSSAEALLLACRTAHYVIKEYNLARYCVDHIARSMVDSAMVQLATAIYVATGQPLDETPSDWNI